MNKIVLSLSFVLLIFIYSCKKKDNGNTEPSAVQRTFGTNIDLNNLYNYASQSRPSYIVFDNSGANPINDKMATLGRVLFYDKKLSSNNSVSCASCHKQTFAFGDTAIASQGVNGKTGRHSMRLINNRFSQEVRYFWDERANSLEIQTTMPIQDHNEMGYSGLNGDQGINDLIIKLSAIDYYKELFNFAFGSEEITEARMQTALSQFIRSIQSFDSKYDIGRALTGNDGQPFNNFTQQENTGKNLFRNPPVFDAEGNRTSGGLGCQGCHRAPEFNIDPNSRNNGIVASLSGGIDLFNTKAPSLRDIVNSAGVPNGPMMHNGIFTDLKTVIGHYGNVPVGPNNTNIDPKLMPNGKPQQLHLTQTEVDAIIAFLKTLTGNDVYTNRKWSDPFL